jgi:hypothetical protein
VQRWRQRSGARDAHDTAARGSAGHAAGLQPAKHDEARGAAARPMRRKRRTMGQRTVALRQRGICAWVLIFLIFVCKIEFMYKFLTLFAKLNSCKSCDCEYYVNRMKLNLCACCESCVNWFVWFREDEYVVKKLCQANWSSSRRSSGKDNELVRVGRPARPASFFCFGEKAV